jgi:hypothetical protein
MQETALSELRIRSCIVTRKAKLTKTVHTEDMNYVRLSVPFLIALWASLKTDVYVCIYLTVLWAGLGSTYCAERLSPVASSLFKEPDNTDIRSGGGELPVYRIHAPRKCIVHRMCIGCAHCDVIEQRWGQK